MQLSDDVWSELADDFLAAWLLSLEVSLEIGQSQRVPVQLVMSVKTAISLKPGYWSQWKMFWTATKVKKEQEKEKKTFHDSKFQLVTDNLMKYNAEYVYILIILIMGIYSFSCAHTHTHTHILYLKFSVHSKILHYWNSITLIAQEFINVWKECTHAAVYKVSDFLLTQF